MQCSGAYQKKKRKKEMVTVTRGKHLGCLVFLTQNKSYKNIKTNVFFYLCLQPAGLSVIAHSYISTSLFIFCCSKAHGVEPLTRLTVFHLASKTFQLIDPHRDPQSQSNGLEDGEQGFCFLSGFENVPLSAHSSLRKL